MSPVCDSIFPSLHYFIFLNKFSTQLFLMSFWSPDTHWLSPPHDTVPFLCVNRLTKWKLFLQISIYSYCVMLRISWFVLTFIPVDLSRISGVFPSELSAPALQRRTGTPISHPSATPWARGPGEGPERLRLEHKGSDSSKQCFFHSNTHMPQDAFLNQLLFPVQRTQIKDSCSPSIS